MAGRAKLKRKSYFVDEHALKRAKKALGVKTEAAVIRLSVERVAWVFLLSGEERNPELRSKQLEIRIIGDNDGCSVARRV